MWTSAFCNSSFEADQQHATLLAEAETLISTPVSTEIRSASSIPVKLCCLFSFMENKKLTPTSSSSTSAAVDEVTTYFSQPYVPEKSNPNEYWHTRSGSLPILSKLAKKFLSILAITVLVERLFSMTGNVFHPECCCLSDTKFHNWYSSNVISSLIEGFHFDRLMHDFANVILNLLSTYEHGSRIQTKSFFFI